MNALELRLAMNVRDFARSVDFYERLLGIPRITAWHDEGDGPGIILRIGPGRTLELFGAPYAEPDAPPVGGGFAIVIQVDDVDAWHARLEAAGVPIARGLVDNPWGDRSFGVVDPDGVRIWFNQVTDSAYAALLG